MISSKSFAKLLDKVVLCDDLSFDDLVMCGFNNNDVDYLVSLGDIKKKTDGNYEFCDLSVLLEYSDGLVNDGNFSKASKGYERYLQLSQYDENLFSKVIDKLVSIEKFDLVFHHLNMFCNKSVKNREKESLKFIRCIEKFSYNENIFYGCLERLLSLKRFDLVLESLKKVDSEDVQFNIDRNYFYYLLSFIFKLSEEDIVKVRYMQEHIGDFFVSDLERIDPSRYALDSSVKTYTVISAVFDPKRSLEEYDKYLNSGICKMKMKDFVIKELLKIIWFKEEQKFDNINKLVDNNYYVCLIKKLEDTRSFRNLVSYEKIILNLATAIVKVRNNNEILPITDYDPYSISDAIEGNNFKALEELINLEINEKGENGNRLIVRKMASYINRLISNGKVGYDAMSGVLRKNQYSLEQFYKDFDLNKSLLLFNINDGDVSVVNDYFGKNFSNFSICRLQDENEDSLLIRQYNKSNIDEDFYSLCLAHHLTNGEIAYKYGYLIDSFSDFNKLNLYQKFPCVYTYAMLALTEAKSKNRKDSSLNMAIVNSILNVEKKEDYRSVEIKDFPDETILSDLKLYFSYSKFSTDELIDAFLQDRQKIINGEQIEYGNVDSCSDNFVFIKRKNI